MAQMDLKLSFSNVGEWLSPRKTKSKHSESDGLTWLAEVRIPLKRAHF